MSRLGTDTATALAVGRRDRQEDAVVAEFSQGEGIGFAVLSDGMGGHGAGDVASKLIVSEMFSELLFSCADADHVRGASSDILRGALDVANSRLKDHAESQPDPDGMGGTLITTMVIDNALRWISVGDSPLYLFRDGALRQLNEDHSMAPQIDLLVAKGLMDAKAARNHPQRHCLTSAITGEAIDKIDCPDEALPLEPGDIIVMASDGLQVLDDAEIQRVIAKRRKLDSRGLANALMAAVTAADEPHQDNISLVVIKMLPAVAEARAAAPAPRAGRTRVGLRRWFLSPVRSLFATSDGNCQP
ncbi:PP2C family protein-serine/threonine phosphatase [Pseudooceanicola sp. LIPI14-2-Ac024]|uniref:PP2C family protein-serine/threonine phosphatase n=1 Tax=Pseudooceanicola sp. LIPI14-2-Ac024 TaxID=3344875 RepID=UPI0035CF3804